MKKSEGDRLKSRINESTLSTVARSPFPNGKGSDTRTMLSSTQSLPLPLSKGRGLRGYSLLPMEGGAPKGRRLDGGSGISVSQPSPRGEGGERSEPDRVLAV